MEPTGTFRTYLVTTLCDLESSTCYLRLSNIKNTIFTKMGFWSEKWVLLKIAMNKHTKMGASKDRHLHTVVGDACKMGSHKNNSYTQNWSKHILQLGGCFFLVSQL